MVYEDFGQFLMELDGNDADDAFLLDALYRYPDEIMRKSGKPVALLAMRRKGMVYANGLFGNAWFTELHIFADMHGEYWEYTYSSKAYFLINDYEYGQYNEKRYGDRQAMADAKVFYHSLCSLIAERLTGRNVFYGIGNTKYLIDNTWRLWREETA